MIMNSCTIIANYMNYSCVQCLLKAFGFQNCCQQTNARRTPFNYNALRFGIEQSCCSGTNRDSASEIRATDTFTMNSAEYTILSPERQMILLTQFQDKKQLDFRISVVFWNLLCSNFGVLLNDNKILSSWFHYKLEDLELLFSATMTP